MSSEAQPLVGLVGHASVSRLSGLSSEDGNSIPSGTDSSLSFAWGPGAIAGKFIKWIGEISLDATVLVIIRGRLMVIKQAVRKRPQMFLHATAPAEEQDLEVQRMYQDLKTLCREEFYPLAIRRKAARLVLEIAFSVYLNQFHTLAEFSRSLSTRATQEDPWDRWNTLLRLSNISALSRVGNAFPLPSDGTWEDTGVGVAAATTTATYTTTSGVTPSGFFSEARTSATSLGDMSRQKILDVGARRILSRIKKIIRQRPHIFVNPKGAKQIREVDYIHNELQDFSRFHVSPNTQRTAARLILEIAVIVSGPSGVIILDDISNHHDMWLRLIHRPYVHFLLSPAI